MSSHTQNSPTQTTVDGGQANFEAALRIATVIVEANQRLFKLQSEAANAAFAENSKHLMSSLSTKDSGALLGEWARLYEANTRRVLDVTRSCFEIMPQTQAQLHRLPLWDQQVLQYRYLLLVLQHLVYLVALQGRLVQGSPKLHIKHRERSLIEYYPMHCMSRHHRLALL